MNYDMDWLRQAATSSNDNIISCAMAERLADRIAALEAKNNRLFKQNSQLRKRSAEDDMELTRRNNQRVIDANEQATAWESACVCMTEKYETANALLDKIAGLPWHVMTKADIVEAIEAILKEREQI